MADSPDPTPHPIGSIVATPYAELNAAQRANLFRFCANRLVQHGDTEGDHHVRGLRQAADELEVMLPPADLPSGANDDRRVVLVKYPASVDLVAAIAQLVDRHVPGAVVDATHPNSDEWMVILSPAETEVSDG